MSKFKNSKESVSSDIYLWYDRPTQVAIKETYDLKVWPITNIYNDGPINFKLPEQTKGMLQDLHIVTKLKIQKNGEDFDARQRDISVVNNFANSLWDKVEILVDDRIDITQNMRNAYAYKSFFNHALNSASNREDYLLYNELFKMDKGKTKYLEENSRIFWKWNENLDDKIKGMMDSSITEKDEALERIKELLWTFDWKYTQKHCTGIANILGPWGGDDHVEICKQVKELVDIAWLPTSNESASERSRFVNNGQSITVDAKLHCPLFTTSKCLPHNMKIRISLTKNSDSFLLLTDDEGYSINIEECYLLTTYVSPHDVFLEEIDKRLKLEPAPYFVSKPELIIKPVTGAGKFIRITDLFHDKIPAYAFFCLQNSKDFEGSFKTNPFTFIPFKKFQFYIDGTPYFKDPLNVESINNIELGDEKGFEYKQFGVYLRQLYKTLGIDLKGDCLINSKNFALNFMVGISFGADRSNITENHLNLQKAGSNSLEIDMGINTVPEDMVLIIYALYDRQIQIDSERKIHIIE